MKYLKCILAAALLSVAAPVTVFAQVPTADNVQENARPTLKRKVAIGRFSNSTRYGKALLLEAELDPLADQAADMLTARLVDSGKFLVFERSDLDALEREQDAAGFSKKLIGVDTLIVGSVTEFGRQVEGKSGFLNSKMRQVASAAVEVRLVDVNTGRAFFSTKGSGTASIEVGEVMGFGSKAGYDSTLNDKAISAAISDLMTNVLNKLGERRWRSDVLQIKGQQVIISGGPSQGLQVGSRLAVETKGEVVTSGQSGLPITLPGSEVAKIEVISFFGEDSESEGAVAKIVEGTLTGEKSDFVIVETK